MFAISVTSKLLVWYLALRTGDSGPRSRPWTLGTILGLVFGLFDAMAENLPLEIAAVLLACHVVAGWLIMHVYYRFDSIVAAIIVCGLGTAILFFGVPFFLFPWVTRFLFPEWAAWRFGSD